MGTHLGAELLVRLEGILGDAHVAGKMREEVVPAELQCGDLGEGLGVARMDSRGRLQMPRGVEGPENQTGLMDVPVTVCHRQKLVQENTGAMRWVRPCLGVESRELLGGRKKTHRGVHESCLRH